MGSPRSSRALLGPSRGSQQKTLRVVIHLLTLRVICPATPSSNPYLAKIRKARASLPLRYSRASNGLLKVGTPTLEASGILTVGSCAPSGPDSPFIFTTSGLDVKVSVAILSILFATNVTYSWRTVISGRMCRVTSPVGLRCYTRGNGYLYLASKQYN